MVTIARQPGPDKGHAKLIERSRGQATIDPLISDLDRLARESGTTKAEVMVRAIRLYEKTLEEASKGNVIKFIPESELQDIS